MAKHVFPLFLDGAKETVSANESWSGNTSYVVMDTAATVLTVGDAALPGTMLVVLCIHASGPVQVLFTNGIDTKADGALLGGVGESITAMWNGSAWVVIGSAETVDVS